jgi:hypothetical protein
MLKKALASAVMSAAAFATLPSISQEAPKLTEPEKATLKTFQDFQVCSQKGMEKAMSTAIPVVQSILAAKHMAGMKATVEAAKAQGLSDSQVQQIAGTLIPIDKAAITAEGSELMNLIMSGEAAPVRATCLKKLGVSNKDGSDFSEEFNKKLGLVKDKMQKFFQQQDSALPQLKPKPKP